MGLDNQAFKVEKVEGNEDIISLDREAFSKALENIKTRNGRGDLVGLDINKAFSDVNRTLRNFNESADLAIGVGSAGGIPFMDGEMFDSDQAESSELSKEVFETDYDKEVVALVEGLNNALKAASNKIVITSKGFVNDLTRSLDLGDFKFRLKDRSLLGDGELDQNSEINNISSVEGIIPEEEESNFIVDVGKSVFAKANPDNRYKDYKF